jgi:poly [ADP-ribose] polymerase
MYHHYSTDSSTKFAHLVMVTPNNNNKYYTMKQINENEFQVVFGRVGGGEQTTEPMSLGRWNSVYKGKVKKGYMDQTDLVDVQVFVTKEPALEDELLRDDYSAELKQVYQLLKQLSEYSSDYVAANYNVKMSAVSLKQIEEAQKYLDNLAGVLLVKLKTASTDEETSEIKAEIDQQLLKLYAVIPRKMNNVNRYLIGDKDVTFAESLISSEQQTLDVMKSQVALHNRQQVKQQSTEEEELETKQPEVAKGKYEQLLQTMDIELLPVTDPQEIDMIKSKMDYNSNLFDCAFKVVNHRTQNNYNSFVSNRSNKQQVLFWHGSRNENWLSILRSGLELRPANAVINGKMFGYGTYFADKFEKSLGYTSLHGSYWAGGNSNTSYLALFNVHVGKQLNIHSHHSWCSSLDQVSLKKYSDYDSVFAHASNNFLRNNEYIVYDESQCTIQYLVQIKR